MDRSQFIKGLAAAAGAAVALPGLARAEAGSGEPAPAPSPVCEDTLKKTESDREFVNHWLADLLEAAEQQLDHDARVKLVEHCGKRCYERYSFKHEIAANGRGSVDKLVTALQANFESWREGDLVHIRYGKVSKGCYCPAAKYRPPKPGDLHCECTRSMHQTICETALGRPLKVDILESVRRGGQTCHFVVHV